MRTREEKEKLVYCFNQKHMNDEHITIYELTGKTKEIFPKNPEYGINWAAIGTQTVKESTKFMNNLSEVIGFVKFVNQDFKDEGDSQ